MKTSSGVVRRHEHGLPLRTRHSTSEAKPRLFKVKISQIQTVWGCYLQLDPRQIFWHLSSPIVLTHSLGAGSFNRKMLISPLWGTEPSCMLIFFTAHVGLGNFVQWVHVCKSTTTKTITYFNLEDNTKNNNRVGLNNKNLWSVAHYLMLNNYNDKYNKLHSIKPKYNKHNTIFLM